MENDAVAAATALADIAAQQNEMRRRVAADRWPPPALGPVLGVLTASLAWRNLVLFTVVSVAYLVSLLPLLGTPAKLGVVPRTGRRSLTAVVVAFLFVAATPMLAVTGPWWTSVVAGAGAVVFVPVFGRWRRAQVRHDLSGPAVQTPGPFLRRVDAGVLQAVFVPVAVVAMTGSVLALGAGWDVFLLVYVAVQLLVQRRQYRVGAIPAGERTAAFWAGFLVSGLVLYGTPFLLLVWPGHDSRLLVAGCATAVAIVVGLVGWWQQHRLPTAAPPR